MIQPADVQDKTGQAFWGMSVSSIIGDDRLHALLAQAGGQIDRRKC